MNVTGVPYGSNVYGSWYFKKVPIYAVWLTGIVTKYGGLLITITLKTDVAYIAPSNKMTVMGYIPVKIVIGGAIENV